MATESEILIDITFPIKKRVSTQIYSKKMINKSLVYKLVISSLVALIFGYSDLKNGRYLSFMARLVFIFIFAQAIVLFSQSRN